MTKLCDFSELTKPLRHYTHAVDVKLDDDTYGVVLRRDLIITYKPVVFKSDNKYDVRLAIREANEILSAIHRLKGDTSAQ